MLAQSSSGSWYKSARLIASIAGWTIRAGRSHRHVLVQAGGDRLRAVQGLTVGRVYLQVINDAPVDKLRLRGGHPGDPVTPSQLAGRGDGCLTPDADPQHLEAAERGLPPLLG